MGTKLTDERLEMLAALVDPFEGTKAKVSIPAEMLLLLVREVEDYRAEVLRRDLCETVDQILEEEQG